MNHRHLLPNEIDLLVDGEVGFGVAPLRAHVEQCPACRQRLDEARVVVEEIEHLGHFAPSAGFADRVMSQVHVFVPPQVAVRDAVRGTVWQWLPRARPVRLLAASVAGSLAVALTIASLWVVTRLDLAVVFTEMAAHRLRLAVIDGLGALAAAAFGDAAAGAIRSAGMAGVAGALLLLVLAATIATVGLRAAAAAARRQD